MHTGEIVGFGQDAFELDPIFPEIQSMCEKIESTNSNVSDENTNYNKLNLVKHHLIFIMQTWKKSGEVMSVLNLYGWKVNTITGDGAAEN
eukprot:2425958-Ditylum_brightwellii.AAC.1